MLELTENYKANKCPVNIEVKNINLQTKNSERSQYKTLNDISGDDNPYLYKKL